MVRLAQSAIRIADVPGVGGFRSGQNFGVFGKGVPNGGVAGVFGQHNRGEGKTTDHESATYTVNLNDTSHLSEGPPIVDGLRVGRV
jgi:hypothetical protein